ncbi:MAG: hypothetical protein ACK4PK_06680 [Alphaproteobacteria bacterium]
MPSFYHGTSALFDQFDDSKAGKNSAVGHFENGRGTYLSSDLDWASGWQNRFDGPFAHTKRVDITDEAWEQNFLPQDRVFTRAEAAQIATDAASLGYHGAADTLAHIIRNNAKREPEVPALTGRDIAMASRYDPEINHFLHDKGFYGYKYAQQAYGDTQAENPIFFKASDIPQTTPMYAAVQESNEKRIGYETFIKRGEAALNEKGLPTALEKQIDILTERLDRYAAENGIDSAGVDVTKGDIRKLAALGATQEDYDPRKAMHPLKLAETAVTTGMGNKARADLSAAVADFVHDGLKTLGHESPPARLEARQITPFGVTSSFLGQDGSLSAFRKHLTDPAFIASEELSSARSTIARSHPEILQSFDRLIDAMHAPGVDFSMRDAMGHAVNRAMRGHLEPQGGETTLGNLRTNLENNAAGCRVDCTKLINEAAAFGESLKAKIEKPAAPAQDVNEKPAPQAKSRFSPV